jgi:hypothetical protein
MVPKSAANADAILSKIFHLAPWAEGMSRDGVGGDAIGIETQLALVAQTSRAENIMVDISLISLPETS